jgi:hypothetical protein
MTCFGLRTLSISGAVLFMALTAGGAEKGATAIVPGWTWVEPIDMPRTDSFPATCGIEREGMLTVLGSDAEGVLVQYQAPHRYKGGTPCRGGERFLLSHTAFEAMTPTYEASKAREAAQQTRIQRMLKEQP